jgi:hypothetical protein
MTRSTQLKFDFVIGNPPYGVAANMAVKFLNKSTELSDDVRMVLPASFQRDSVLNRINLDYELVHDERLPDDTFPRDITTVFQQWKRAEEPREKIVIYREHPDFEFLKYKDRSQASLFIGGAGAGPSGKVKTEGYDHYKPGHHYVRCTEEITQRLIDIQPALIKQSRVCGCLPGLGKHDIIKVYMEAYG